MYTVTCPQCNKKSSGPSSRLVLDSCGHQKCRVCLLEDEENCKQCLAFPSSETKLVDKLDLKPEDNRTGVITHCNNSKLVNKHSSESSVKNLIDTNIPLVVNAVQQCDMVAACNETLKTVDYNLLPKKSKTSRRKTKKLKNSEEVASRNYQTIAMPNHISVFDHPLVYKCNICTKVFSSKSQVKYHRYCSGIKKPYQCGQCNSEFISKSHYNIHLLKHSNIKPHICKICNKGFTESAKLKRHSIIHTNLKPYICSICGKTFKTKDVLRIHSFIHQADKKYTCNICSAKFTDSSNFKKHLVSHSSEKIHMCDQCGKRFKLKWALTVHRRSHLRLRPHECNICSKTFINKKELQRHQLIHFDSKSYSCSICHTEFKRKDNLLRHIKNTHPGKNAEPIKKIKSSATAKSEIKPVDTPNAIKVITASPIFKKFAEKTDLRPATVINGPIKLAFKTNAFKSNYNIQREPPPKIHDEYDLEESVNICQKILSPHSPPRNIIKKVSDVTSSEICQKILAPYTTPLHYETSFEHKKHGYIKNIKFKVPADYINLKTNNSIKNITPIKPTENVNFADELFNTNTTFTELKPVSNVGTSVIVNSSNQQSDLHWRRRTLQNLNQRIK